MRGVRGRGAVVGGRFQSGRWGARLGAPGLKRGVKGVWLGGRGRFQSGQWGARPGGRAEMWGAGGEVSVRPVGGEVEGAGLKPGGGRGAVPVRAVGGEVEGARSGTRGRGGEVSVRPVGGEARGRAEAGGVRGAVSVRTVGVRLGAPGLKPGGGRKGNPPGISRGLTLHQKRSCAARFFRAARRRIEMGAEGFSRLGGEVGGAD